MDSKITTLPAGRNATLPQLLDATTPMLRSPPSPAWLEGWRAEYGNPPVSGREIQTSLSYFEDRTAPSTRAQVSAVLAAAVDLFGPPADHATKFPLYISLLEDIPPDLLAYGAWRAMQECEFFPKPAQIRAPIKEELARRNLVKKRLGFALWMAQRSERRRAS